MVNKYIIYKAWILLLIICQYKLILKILRMILLCIFMYIRPFIFHTLGDRAVNNPLPPSSQTRNVGRPSQGQHSQHSMNSSSRVNMVAPSQRGDSRELATTSRKRIADSSETERASKVRLLDLPLPWVSEEKVDTIESEAAVLYAHNVCAPELSFKQPAVGVTSKQPTIGLSGRSSLGISTKESTLGLSCTETIKCLSSKRVAVCSSHTSLPNIQNNAQETTTHDPSMNKVLKTVPYKIPKTVPSSEYPQNLEQMKHIIFLDLDNWANFFGHLPERLPDKTYVWGFYGGKRSWFEPRYVKNKPGLFLRFSFLSIFFVLCDLWTSTCKIISGQCCS